VGILIIKIVLICDCVELISLIKHIIIIRIYTCHKEIDFLDIAGCSCLFG